MEWKRMVINADKLKDKPIQHLIRSASALRDSHNQNQNNPKPF